MDIEVIKAQQRAAAEAKAAAAAQRAQAEAQAVAVMPEETRNATAWLIRHDGIHEALMALADEARRTEAKAQLECLYGGSKDYAQQCRDEADEHRSALASAIRQHIESTAAELEAMKTELANALARDIHSCHADCTRAGCVNARLREDLERKSDELEKLKQWSQAYPRPLSEDESDVATMSAEKMAEALRRMRPYVADASTRSGSQGRVGLTDAARDVLAERARQVSSEGWTREHDDEHDEGQLSLAAAGYAWAASDQIQCVSKEFDGPESSLDDPVLPNEKAWPFGWEFKVCPPRRALIKAGALILAEIERLDRTHSIPAATPGATKEQGHG